MQMRSSTGSLTGCPVKRATLIDSLESQIKMEEEATSHKRPSAHFKPGQEACRQANTCHKACLADKVMLVCLAPLAACKLPPILCSALLMQWLVLLRINSFLPFLHSILPALHPLVHDCCPCLICCFPCD
jgi:hypothetical protein